MSKRRGPKGDDFVRRSSEIETRLFTVKREGLEPPSSVTLHFDCPFCDAPVRAYLWSISGGGKRCDCGAYFGRYGRARHWKAAGQEVVS